jgi:hypothetical protein
LGPLFFQLASTFFLLLFRVRRTDKTDDTSCRAWRWTPGHYEAIRREGNRVWLVQCGQALSPTFRLSLTDEKTRRCGGPICASETPSSPHHWGEWDPSGSSTCFGTNRDTVSFHDAPSHISYLQKNLYVNLQARARPAQLELVQDGRVQDAQRADDHVPLRVLDRVG